MKDIMKGKDKVKLTIGHFKREGLQGSFGHTFTYKDGKYEVCLESCLNGYDVAVYDSEQNLIGEKECTNTEGMEFQIIPGFSIATGEALEDAVRIANKKYNKVLKETNE